MALTVVFALSACGGSKEEGTDTATDNATNNSPTDEVSGDAREIALKAANFEFDQKEYKAKVGETVKFTLVNEEGVHGVQMDGIDVNLDVGNPSQTVTLNEAGTYEIICSVFCGTGHSDMKSTLIVE